MAENKNHTPGRTASDDTLNDILSEIKKEPAQPGPLEQTRSFGNEVPVDDNFEQFFKKTVAVIPGQEPEADADDGEYYECDEQEAGGFFARFLHHGKKPRTQHTQELPPLQAAIEMPQSQAQPARQDDLAEAVKAVQQREAQISAEKLARQQAEALAEAQKREAELARRQAEEKAARELARQQALEQAAKETQQRMAAEKAAREQAEREAKERAAEELATRLTAEKQAKEKAAQQAAALAAEQAQAAEQARQQAEAQRLAEEAKQRMEQRAAQRASMAQAALEAIEKAEQQPEEPTQQPEVPAQKPEVPQYEQEERRDLGEGQNDTMSVKLDLPDLPEPEEAPQPRKEKPHSGKMRAALHLFGRASDEADETEENTVEFGAEPAARADEEEFVPRRAAAAVQDPDTPEEMHALLAAQKASALLRTVLAGLAALLLIYLGAAARGGTLPLLEMIDPQLAPAPFLAVNMIVMLAACGLGFDMLRHGASGILGRPTGDTMPMLAMLGAMLQLAVFLVKTEWYDPLHITIFAGPAVLLLCMDQAGRYMQAASAFENNELIQAGVDHEIAAVCTDQDETLRLAEGLDEEDPILLLSRPAGRLQEFLRRSYSDSENESRLQHLSWALTLCALLAAALCVGLGGDAAGAVSSAAGLLCMGAPLASILGSSLPMELCSKGAARVGAVVPGWESAEELAESNLLHVTSDDLFPSGCIHLHGIKTFRKERIDLAILYAASVMQYSSNGLKEVFMGILQNDSRLLFKTEGVTKTAGKGIVAWIDNQRVIMGNREMMAEHNIEIPSMDYENRYTKGQRSPVYLAVAGRLYGMFLLSYATDRTVHSTLQMLRAEGYSLLVSSDDFCISRENIENAYGLNPGEVRLLNNAQKNRLAPRLAFAEASGGCMVHLGSFASAAGGIRAALAARAAGRAASLMITASVAASCVFGIALAVTGGLAGLVLPAVVLYQAAWCGLTLAAPAMKKY